MSEPTNARDIIAVYVKHGWKLGRVLLSETTRTGLGEKGITELFGESRVQRSDFDAIWFERGAKGGGTAIELRSLSAEPFALFEIVPADEDPEPFRARLELRMAERASKPPSAKSH